MATQFKYLFNPIKIGSLTVKNRLAWAPHTTLMGTRDGMPVLDQWKVYYEARARGGVGLIITEPLQVHPTSQPYDESLRGWDERIVPFLQKVAEVVPPYGTKILAQLMHAGQYSKEVFTMRESWAPSPLPPAQRYQTPKEMEEKDIREIVAAFVKAARFVKLGGFDGCQLHASNGYLLYAFITPLVNKRTDKYGGSLDNRLRIIYEIIEGVRKECGNDFVVGIRLCGDDLLAGGLEVTDAQEVVRHLEKHGGLDFFDMTIGTYYTHLLAPTPMDVPLGYSNYAGKAIKEVVKSTPVFIGGGIKDPTQSEQILSDGYADMIMMCRSLITDPELPNKAREGRIDDIRPCLRCRQGCIGRRSPYETWPSCVINPMAGREASLGTPQSASQKKSVMIIGGGPAGLEAARVAASRGHRVSLYEKQGRLGGQINVQTRQPTREEFGDSVRWLSNQINKLGVKVYLNTEVTVELVEKLGTDAVVVATGSRPLRNGFSANRPNLPGIPGADRKNVLTVWEVLQETAPVGERVVLIDNEGNQAGVGTAEFLAERGKKLMVVTRLLTVGDNMKYERPPTFFMSRLLSHGAVLYTAHNVKQIGERRVVLENSYTQQEVILENVDTVVLNTGWAANNELYHAMKDKVKELYAVGDCLAPRDTLSAIFDGHRIGRQI